MEKIRNAGFAFILVLGALLVSIAITMVINTHSFLELYTKDFHFRPGPRFAARLISSMPAQDQTCLIIGSSTAREGLDPAIIEKAQDGVKIINAATTGGNTTVQEIQMSIIDRFNLHYRCIIVQVHPWLLYQNSVAVPDLEQVQYDVLLDAGSMARLSFMQADKVNIPLALAYIVPMKKHAAQLNLFARKELHDLHNAAFSEDLPLSQYEKFEAEFTPSPDWFYEDIKKPEDRIVKGLKDNDFYEPAIYTDPRPVAAFQRAIDLAAEHADQVIVLGMPDDEYFLKEPNAWALPAYQKLLSDNADKISYVDCRKGFARDLFVDEAHLGSKGRAKLSKDFGKALNAVLTASKAYQDGTCSLYF